MAKTYTLTVDSPTQDQVVFIPITEHQAEAIAGDSAWTNYREISDPELEDVLHIGRRVRLWRGTRTDG